jgi:hypothetical protein
MCLMLWNEPIARPNCWRTFAYSTAMSRHASAPPTCSAHEAHGGQVQDHGERARAVHRAQSSVLASTTPSKRRLARRRVWSMVGSAVRVSPAVSPGSTNRPSSTGAPSLASIHAATTSRLALWPSTT